MSVWISRRPEHDVTRDIETGRAAPAGPLAGLRLAVKDNVDVAGLPTTAACPGYAYDPAADAPVVAALRAAGAVVVGKTNLDQFATGLVGTRSPYGPVADARRPAYVSGGSSSGSAVAVATGEADIAIGTDTAGSGRVPAAFAGIVGIKPTVGVVSTVGVVPACESYDCPTVFARDLAGADAAMAAMAGARGARAWPADTRFAAPPHPVVAVPAALTDLPPEAARAFAAVRDALAGRAQVREIDLTPFLAASPLLYGGALVAERYAAVGAFLDSHGDGAAADPYADAGLDASLDPTVAAIIRAARDIPAHRLVADRREVARLREEALAALGDAHALLVPTVPRQPTLAEVAADPVGVNASLGVYTSFANLLDLCGVAVPAGEADGGHFGVSVLARAFDDAVALDVAALVTGTAPPAAVWPTAVAPITELVVFGAHLRGGVLAHQLTGRGARWAGEVATAPRYRMAGLPTTPPKPAVFRAAEGTDGVSVTGHRWLLSPAALGAFLAELPAPMQLGQVELDDGTWHLGFGCDGAAAAAGVDVSRYRSWPAALASGVLATPAG